MSFFSFQDNSPKVKARTYGCQSCGLNRACTSPKLQMVGEGRKGILLIGETPSAEEDARGQLLNDGNGKFLRKSLKELGIDLDRDCTYITAIGCACKKFDKHQHPIIKTVELQSCFSRIEDLLKLHKFPVVILLGDAAIESWIGRNWKKELEGVSKWRGWTIPDHEHNCWVCPTWSPSVFDGEYVLPAVQQIWMADLERAIRLNREPLTPALEESHILIMDEEDAVTYLTDMLWEASNEESRIELPQQAVDIEATGLKPHNRGHRILSCAIADGNFSRAFMLTPKVAPLLCQFMQAEHIKKIAANAKYEDTWFAVLYGIETQGWAWDTVVAAHTMDNRPGTSNVKFQACVNFGIYDYDSGIEPFKEGSEDNNANSFNRMHEVPVKDLLLYNGWDSLIEWHLAQKQQGML